MIGLVFMKKQLRPWQYGRGKKGFWPGIEIRPKSFKLYFV